MRYVREIKSCNEQAHLDIEQDMQVKKNGLFTFILRVNNGTIVDYNVMECIDATKYDGLEQGIIEELTATYHNQSGDTGDTVRTTHIQYRTEERRG
jgi:hypothetical protein